MLDIQHLTRRYQNKLAVSDLSLTFEKGKTYALLGPNGSGKTTLMKMIAGLTKQTSGEITLDGIPVGPETKKHIAYMPTESYFYSYMSIADAGKYYADFFEDFDERRYEGQDSHALLRHERQSPPCAHPQPRRTGDDV